MDWNTRYSSEDNINLNIDADFTPDKSFKNISEMAKIMRQKPGCLWCGKDLEYKDVAQGVNVCSDECYERMHA
jgi:hypothetical protein